MLVIMSILYIYLQIYLIVLKFFLIYVIYIKESLHDHELYVAFSGLILLITTDLISLMNYLYFTIFSQFSQNYLTVIYTVISMVSLVFLIGAYNHF